MVPPPKTKNGKLVKDYFEINLTNINDQKFLNVVLKLKKVKGATGLAYVEDQLGTLGKWCHRQRKESWCFRQRKESLEKGTLHGKGSVEFNC